MNPIYISPPDFFQEILGIILTDVFLLSLNGPNVKVCGGVKPCVGVVDRNTQLMTPNDS